MLATVPRSDNFKLIKFSYSDNCYGTLIPFSRELTSDKVVLEKLSKWRNANLKYFLDQNPSTIESTHNYLMRVLADKNHQMYLIRDNKGVIAGHVGYRIISSKVAELDNLVRSEDPLPNDFIEKAEKALIQSIFTQTKADSVILKVLGSNVLAKRIHLNLGFEILEVKPCYRTEKAILTENFEGNSSKTIAGYIVHMILDRKINSSNFL